MPEIPNSQNISATSSGAIDFSTLSSLFKTNMDTVLVGGRDITLHLPPSKDPCTDPNCSFNSFYKKYMGNNGQVCQTCGGQGFIYEHRWTVYRANIRWTNEPFDNLRGQKEEIGTLSREDANFVRTKTVIESYDDIRNSKSASVDNIHVELVREPRKIGFAGNLHYVVSWWKVING